MGNSSSSSSYYYNSKVNSNIGASGSSSISIGDNDNMRSDAKVNSMESTTGASVVVVSTYDDHHDDYYDSNSNHGVNSSAAATIRRSIITGNSSRSSNNTTNINIHCETSSTTAQQQQQQQQQHVWRGPFSEILHPRKAAMLLGKSTTRRIIRAFRRVIALDQLSSSSYNNNNNNQSTASRTYADKRYLRHGIFCYEDTTSFTNNNNNDTNTNDDSSSSPIELIFLNEENASEAKELNQIMEWFFSSSSSSSSSSIVGNVNINNICIDFLSFRHLILPPHVIPPSGILDCIFTAMSTATTSTSIRRTTSTIVKLPDYISFVAIFKYGTLYDRSHILFKVYHSLHFLRGNISDATTTTASTTSTTTTISVEQHNNNISSEITRDTMSRFIFNVHGNDILQSETAQQLLQDLFFNKSQQASTNSISLQQFVHYFSTTTTSQQQDDDDDDDDDNLMVSWIDTFIQYTLCPLPNSNNHLDEEKFSTSTRKLQITCARYSITRLMMLECKRKFYSILQLQQSSETKQQQQHTSSNISYSKFVQVTTGFLCTSLAKLTFIAGCSSCSCPCYHHHHHHHHKTNHFNKSINTHTKPPSSSLLVVVKEEVTHDNNNNNGNDAISPQQLQQQQQQVEEEEQSSFSSLHRTYSAVHPQSFAVDMITNTTTTPTESGDGTTVTSTAADMNQDDILQKTIHTAHKTATVSENIMCCTCSWTLYDSIVFSCAAVRTSCCCTQLDDDEEDVDDEEEDLPLLQFVFRVFRQQTDDNDDASIWKYEKEWHEEEGEQTKIIEPLLSKQQIGKMMILLLEQHYFRQHMDNNLSSLVEEFSPQRVIIHNSQVCILQKDVVTLMGRSFFESKTATTILPLIQVVQSVLNSSHAMTFSQFVLFSKQNLLLLYYMQELRLLAGVIFGVRPSTPKKERDLIRELIHRHLLRHSSTATNPRGPPGTIWNLISSNWMDQWNLHSTTTSTANATKATLSVLDEAVQGGGEISRNSTPALISTTTNVNNDDEISSPPPPPPLAIDNNSLLRAGSLVLRSNLRHVRDFLLVPPLVWDALQAWYDGGPPIERKVVKKSITLGTSTIHSSPTPDAVESTSSEVELYPFCLTIALADAATGQPRPFQQWQLVSRLEPVQSLLDTCCFSLHMSSPENARLWQMGGDGDCRLLDLKMSLNDQIERADEATTIMLEVRGEDGIWPRSKVITSDDNTNNIPTPISSTATSARPGKLGKNNNDAGGDGIVGLYNMGNTCYLNSSMQCLSHTPLLREYFTSKSYLSDINTTNPLGYQGLLAQVSAMLLIQLWKPRNASGSAALTPKSFKDALGKFNDHFAGNEQHDAQELLAFLLSGLSEDLNRIVDKPYIEQPDSDGRPDRELADIWWKNHLLREMSIIVALFTGQYKSLLTCKTCGYESARFEPFAFLQLPLQEDELIPITMIVYRIERSKPALRYSVRVNKDGTIDDVLITLCKIIYQDELSFLRAATDNTRVVISSDANRDLRRRLLRKSSTFSDSKCGDANEEELDDDDHFYRQMANNFAVVDMRECRINSITPSSRSLSQIRESDILCVYEIDPMHTETQYVDTTIDSNIGQADQQSHNTSSLPASSSEEPASNYPKPLIISLRSDYIALAQRRLEPIGRPYLHQFTMRVFGVPLLLRIVLNKYTGSQLYDIVAERLQRPIVGADSNVPHTSSYATPKSFVSGTSCEIETKKKRLKATTMDLVEVAGGTMPRHGFRLRVTSRDGKRCSRCLWYECCIGCEIPDDSGPTAVQDGDTVVIDWHLESSASRCRIGVAGPAVSASKEQALFHACVERHRSCRFDGNDITLEECLDKFTKEEDIPDAYCSKCKDFRSSTKHMSIWRLPPIMIIHLKRFQFTQHFRRKLRNMVVFPVEGLDLSRILAFDDDVIENDETNHAATSTSSHISVSEEDSGQEDATWVSNSDNGRPSESLYDLYGVVHHLGALSGGHYVASVRSEKDGKWRIFNDAQVTEISSKDIVDASAYILFYVRRDMKHVKLQDLWDTSSRIGEGITEDQIDKLVKQRSDRCVIS